MQKPSSMPSDRVQQQLRAAFSAFPTGVVAVCGVTKAAARVGMAVNSFTSISLDPPLVAVSIAKASRTWPLLQNCAVLGLSVLGSGQEQISRNLAAREGDRFAGAAWQLSPDGALHLPGAALWLSCVLHSQFDGGDHTIVLLEVIALRSFPDVAPLIFHLSQYRAIKAD